MELSRMGIVLCGTDIWLYIEERRSLYFLFEERGRRTAGLQETLSIQVFQHSKTKGVILLLLIIAIIALISKASISTLSGTRDINLAQN